VTIDIKTLNCQLGGGVAAIIYNDMAGSFEGELSSTSAVTIPSLHVMMAEGSQLLSLGLEKTLTIEQQKGYGYLSGTSMAAPYVTGVIAKVWRSVSRLFSHSLTMYAIVCGN
jgi:serine protease